MWMTARPSAAWRERRRRRKKDLQSRGIVWYTKLYFYAESASAL